jgi:hypothetical protein
MNGNKILEKNYLLTQVSKILFKGWTQKLSSTRNPSSSLRSLQLMTENKNPETIQLRVDMFMSVRLSVCLSSFSSPPMQTNTRTTSRILCNNCQNTHNHFQPINSIISVIITSIFFFLFIRGTPQCNSTIPSVNITMRIMFLSQGNFFNYENHPSLITIFCFFLHFSNSYMQLNDISEPQHDHPSTSSSPSFLKLLHATLTTFLNHNMITHDHP